MATYTDPWKPVLYRHHTVVAHLSEKAELRFEKPSEYKRHL